MGDSGILKYGRRDREICRLSEHNYSSVAPLYGDCFFNREWNLLAGQRPMQKSRIGHFSSGGLEVAWPLPKSKVTGLIPTGVDKFSGCESSRHKDMDVCKCIVPARHECTLNSRRAASPPVRLVEGEDKLEASDSPLECSPSKLGRNRTKSYFQL
ncbi:hypothetical protein TNCV_2484621 [Trichonephila clavipes]|uniref:Uncharacterized protein n=1 Tax=Trichonephila clavipes TaxID=2585209 RepID=A0A8X6VZB2_TRICX|nr:hypothetical protein TNCV_2484621 [Trichonephila clavipes]